MVFQRQKADFYGCGIRIVTCSNTPKNHRATKEDNNKTWYRWLLFMRFIKSETPTILKCLFVKLHIKGRTWCL
ncbi:hypothetical protein Hanom_Chr01g00074021 [Helianthus anomalus]